MTKPLWTIGVDLGGTNIAAAAVDFKGCLRAHSQHSTLAKEGPAKVLARLSAQILEVLQTSSLTRSEVAGVGVGCPGPLNARTGVVQFAPNLPGWRNVPLGRMVAAKTGFRVALDNDARAAALGEALFGAGRGRSPVLLLSLGTGVGGGIVLDGVPLSGPDTTAGELGHMALDPRGPHCNCGQAGCLEQYASATAIARRSRALVLRVRRGPLWRLCGGDAGRITAKLAHQALRRGDPVARQVWKETAWALGTAIAGYLNIFNPERVILTGGVMQGGTELLKATRRVAFSKAFSQPSRRAHIVRASLGNDAGVIGAAAIARRAFVGHFSLRRAAR